MATKGCTGCGRKMILWNGLLSDSVLPPMSGRVWQCLCGRTEPAPPEVSASDGGFAEAWAGANLSTAEQVELIQAERPPCPSCAADGVRSAVAVDLGRCAREALAAGGRSTVEWRHFRCELGHAWSAMPAPIVPACC